MLKVYFVDDDNLILEELKTIIDWSKHGFEICGFSTDSLTAKEEILNFNPQLVISDVQMDELNGLKLAEEIGKINPKINFCFLSAFDKFDYAIEAIRIGAIRYLKKPIKASELYSILDDIREKEVKKISYQVAAVLANANSYQDNELCLLFEQSPLFKKNVPFRVVVAYGNISGFDISSCCSSGITLHSDDVMEINVAYDLEVEKLQNMIVNKAISVGVSEEADNYNDISRLLKTARIASKNKFITDKNEVIIYHQNEKVDSLLEDFKNVHYAYELEKKIMDLKQMVIDSNITVNYLQIIYQTIVYMLMKFEILDYDTDVINLSAIHFYSSIDQMVDDLLANFDEQTDQDFSVTLLNEIKIDISKNLSNKISLSDYAKKYGYNTSYFSQWFKKMCGKSFVEYVISERIELAKSLIVSKPQLTLRNIASDTGYDDYYHFSKIFKKYTGLSPLEFQNNVKNKL